MIFGLPRVATAIALSCIVNSVSGTPKPDLVFPLLTIGIDSQKRDVYMPMGGIGTWMYNSSQAEDEVLKALKLGSRLVDTAHMYANQDGIGRAIKKSGIPRKDLFISTKVDGGAGTEATIAAHEENLKLLGVDYVDLLLTHYPCAFPTSPTGSPTNCSKAHRQATWKGLEALYFAGKARAIGVSHYCQKHMEDVLEIAKVKISVNQQEWHVGMGPDPLGLVTFCKTRGISYQGFSPFCGPCPPASKQELLHGELVTSIGKAHNMTGAQVSLRWLVQNGSPVIPKSDTSSHLFTDLSIFGREHELTDKEMARLNAATFPPSGEPVSADCKLELEEVTVVV